MTCVTETRDTCHCIDLQDALYCVVWVKLPMLIPTPRIQGYTENNPFQTKCLESHKLLPAWPLKASPLLFVKEYRYLRNLVMLSFFL